ncbi:MAG: hypothetical protein ACXQTI_00180 [Candidatus Nezhaarchaeales archaeon]
MKSRCTVMLMLVMLVIAISIQTTHGETSQEVSTQLFTKVNVHYTYVDVIYVLQFKGPSQPLTITISLDGFENLYASICEGVLSKSWVINVPSLNASSTYNVTIRALWLMKTQEGKYIINVPLNPST